MAESGMQVKVPLGDADGANPCSRTRWDGRTYVNNDATKIAKDVWRAWGEATYHRWAALIEDRRTGNYFLVPTVEADKDKLRLRWVRGGQAITTNMHKLFRVRGIVVEKGWAFQVKCAPGTLENGKPGMEMFFADGKIVPLDEVEPALRSPRRDAAAGKMPE